MNTSSTGKRLSLILPCALALGFAAGAVQAQQALPGADREVWNDTSKQVWKNGYGECWHSAYGPPPPVGECNPAAVAQLVAPAPAAPYVAPPPSPVPARAQYVAPVQIQPAPAAVQPERPRKRDRN